MKGIIICHPVFYFLLELLGEGKNIREWLAQLHEEPVKIDGYGFFSRKEIEYYYKKYLLLKEKGRKKGQARTPFISCKLSNNSFVLS